VSERKKSEKRGRRRIERGGDHLEECLRVDASLDPHDNRGIVREVDLLVHLLGIVAQKGFALLSRIEFFFSILGAQKVAKGEQTSKKNFFTKGLAWNLGASNTVSVGGMRGRME